MRLFLLVRTEIQCAISAGLGPTFVARRESVSFFALSAHSRSTSGAAARVRDYDQDGNFMASSCYSATCRLSSIRSYVDRSSGKSLSGAIKTR
jgi:hypothetical protein